MATISGCRRPMTVEDLEDDECCLLGSPRFSGQGGSPVEDLAGSPSGQDAPRAQASIGHEETKEEREQEQGANEHTHREEEEEGGGFVPRFSRDTGPRPLSLRDLDQSSGSARSSEYRPEASRDQDDFVGMGPVNGSITHGGYSFPRFKREGSSFEDLAGFSPRRDALRSRRSIRHEEETKEGREQEQGVTERENTHPEEKGGFDRRFSRDARFRAVQTLGQYSGSGRRPQPQYLPEVSRDQHSVRYTETCISNRGHTNPLYSPGRGSLEGQRFARPDASRPMPSTRTEEGKEGEDRIKKREEEEGGRGSGACLNSGMRLEANRALRRNADDSFVHPDDYLREALAINEGQRTLLRNLVDRNRQLRAHAQRISDNNDLLRLQGDDRNRQHDILATEYASLVADTDRNKQLCADAKRVVDQNDILHVERDNHKRQYDILESKYASLVAEADRTRRLCARATRINDENGLLRLEMDGHRRQYDILESKNASLVAAADRNRRLGEHAKRVTHENDLLRVERDEHKRQRDILASKNASLVADADRNRQLGAHSKRVRIENDLLRRQRDSLKRQRDTLASQYASLVAGAGSATAAVAERARLEYLNGSIAKVDRALENARRLRTEEDARRARERDERMPFSPTARERFPPPSVLTSSAFGEDDDSPAARASAFLTRAGTPATRSVTPPVSSTALPAPAFAAYPSAFKAGAREVPRAVFEQKKRVSGRGSASVRETRTASSGGAGRSTRPANHPATVRHGTIASSRGGRPSAAPVNRPSTRRQGVIASSGGLGPSRGPVNRPPSGRQGMISSSGGLGPSAGPANGPPTRGQPTGGCSRGLGHSTRPVDRPLAGQGRVTKKATISYRHPAGCLKGTKASLSRSRAAVKSTAPRGMVF